MASALGSKNQTKVKECQLKTFGKWLSKLRYVTLRKMYKIK